MSVVSHPLDFPLEDDIPRYLQKTMKFVDSVGTYRLFEVFDDNTVPGCNLCVLKHTDDTIIYSAYYKTAVCDPFGSRIVMHEVRQDPAHKGIARTMMDYWINSFGTLRTDLGMTPMGVAMWEKFMASTPHNLYFARLNIDIRTPIGRINQDASLGENIEKLGQVRMPDLWQDKAQEYINVVYATRKTL